ncbi:hypothetical protein PgNI_11156 [Pyricularia grisea]|uniref:Rhodopsin domain-containing protein n=1 Tax=Pyricularia grisea TaxID=148305 RepID=A0A6P8APB6_PYRGI|nr:hypothetical protein PgNI_11156 [Pyricularia grisea]TLD03871.1 hypothetical protein PgNI_11156 [Pyricularia grisea]
MGYHPWDLSTEELIEYLKVGLHTLYSISKQHARLALFPYGSCADKPTRVLQWSYLGGVVYTLAAYFTKVTLLLLIARLLSVKRHVVLGIYAFILAVTIYCFVVFLLKAFACQPVAALWDFRMQADFCVDKRKVYLSETVIDFGTNVAIMVVPIPFITPLRTSLAGKIKIGTLFGIGGIGIFVGAYRLYVVIQFFTEVDATGKAILPCTLSVLELTLGFICACLPPISLLIEKCRNCKRASPKTPRAGLYKRMGRHSGGSTAPLTTVTAASDHTPQMRQDDWDDRHSPQQQASTGRTDADVELDILPGSPPRQPGSSSWSYPIATDTEATGGTANRSAAITYAGQRFPTDQPEQLHSRSARAMQQTTPSFLSTSAVANRWFSPYKSSQRAPLSSVTSSGSMGGIMRTIEITLETSEADKPQDEKATGGDSTGGQSNSRGVQPPLVAMTRAAAGERARTIHARIWDGKSHDLGTRAIGYT